MVREILQGAGTGATRWIELMMAKTANFVSGKMHCSPTIYRDERAFIQDLGSTVESCCISTITTVATFNYRSGFSWLQLMSFCMQAKDCSLLYMTSQTNCMFCRLEMEAFSWYMMLMVQMVQMRFTTREGSRAVSPSKVDRHSLLTKHMLLSSLWRVMVNIVWL
jgi:hypothetical protein